MRRVAGILIFTMLLSIVISSPAHVPAQSVPCACLPACTRCTPPCSGICLSDCSYYRGPGRPGRSKHGISSRDVNAILVGTLFENLVIASLCTDNAAQKKAALEAKQKAIAIAAVRQAELQKAEEAAAQAEFERAMSSYKRLDASQRITFRPSPDYTLELKTLDGDAKSLSTNTRKNHPIPRTP